MLNIYFSASTSTNGEFSSDYKKILEIIKSHPELKLISGEQIIDKELLEKERNASPEEIFQRQKILINQSDAVIAEVTKPSLGVGGEIVYALTQKKPVLALIKTEYEDKISPMIAGNPSENLYRECYSEDNAKFIIEKYIQHIQAQKERKGKLIVIDGGDGSGKTTQAKLLVDYLKQHKIPTKYMDFPQYYQSFHGKVVAKFLRGEFGNIDQVSPYLASLAYALDRASVKEEMEEFLSNGGFIIANRYATSNMAHQGAKFTDEKEREEYLAWEYELEYKVHKIPKEDMVIYLYVPSQVADALTEKKEERKYLEGKLDIQEKDINHRVAAEKMYLELAKRYSHWTTINCIKDSKMLPVNTIQEQILSLIKEKYKI